MSIKLMAKIWDIHSGFLTGTEKSVLIRLADFGSDNGIDIWPGKTRLAKDTGFSVATIKRTLDSLEEKKVITKKNRQSKDQYITNLYTINVKLIDQQLSKKPVDKSKKKDKGVGSQRPQGRVMVTPGVGSQRPPIHHIEPLFNHHSDKKPQSCGLFKENDFLKAELITQLLAFGYFEKEAISAIKKYGIEFIFHAIGTIKEMVREKKINVKNMGAYLRATLEKKNEAA